MNDADWLYRDYGVVTFDSTVTGPTQFVIMGKINVAHTKLLVIHEDGRVEGEIENASEAAKVFVQILREQYSFPREAAKS